MWLVLYCCINAWPKKHNMIIAILRILFHLLVQNIHISRNYCRTLFCSGCRWKHMQKTSSGRVPQKLRIPKKLRKTDFIFLTDLFCWFYHKAMGHAVFLWKSLIPNEFLDFNKWELWLYSFCKIIASLSCIPCTINWLDSCLLCPLSLYSKGILHQLCFLFLCLTFKLFMLWFANLALQFCIGGADAMCFWNCYSIDNLFKRLGAQ